MDVYPLNPRERASLHYCIRNTDGVYPVHYSLKTNKKNSYYCTFFFKSANLSLALDTSTEAYRENTVPQTHILLEVQNIH